MRNSNYQNSGYSRVLSEQRRIKAWHTIRTHYQNSTRTAAKQPGPNKAAAPTEQQHHDRTNRTATATSDRLKQNKQKHSSSTAGQHQATETTAEQRQEQAEGIHRGAWGPVRAGLVFTIYTQWLKNPDKK